MPANQYLMYTQQRRSVRVMSITFSLRRWLSLIEAMAKVSKPGVSTTPIPSVRARLHSRGQQHREGALR